MSEAITRERGLKYRADVVRPELQDQRSTAGNAQFQGVGYSRYCFGCNKHRAMLGSNGSSCGLKWRCAECWAAQKARRLAKLGGAA